MKDIPTVIFVGDDGWKIARADSFIDVPITAGASTDQIASAIKATFNSSTRSAILALPASQCFSATVSLAGLPTRNRRSGMLYRLELLLPLTAEEIVADYILDEPDSAFAICLPLTSVKPTIDALELAGIRIESVIPTPIYAVAGVLNTEKATQLDAIIWQSKDMVQMFTLRESHITGWYNLRSDVDDLHWHINQCFASRTTPVSVLVCNVEPAMLASLKSFTFLKVIVREHLTMETAFISALVNAVGRPVDLRRDGLAPTDSLRVIRRPLIEAVMAMMLLVVCVCSSAGWRAHRLEQVATKYREQQADLFRAVFPGRTVPANIVSRLRSEERRLKSNDSPSGESSLSQTLMPTLQSVLSAVASLPADIRLKVQDLRLDDDRFSLEGTVRSRSDLDRLTDALRQQPNLQVDAPQTEQIPGKGLQINMSGALNLESKPK